MSILKSMEKPGKQPIRLSREQWLQKSFNMLAMTKGRFRIDDLVESMGVTKGSFYYHFKDKADFVKCQMDFWESNATQSVIDEMEKHKGEDASMRLLALMRLLRNKNFCDHDIAIRNMAVWERSVADRVIEVDQMRLEFVRNLFREIGFTGADLDARTHVFAVFHSLREGFLGKKMTDSEEDLMAMYRFFTAKYSDALS